MHGCTKNACFIKSEHFSCSASSPFKGTDVRRGGWGVGQMRTGGGKKMVIFCCRPLWTAHSEIWSVRRCELNTNTNTTIDLVRRLQTERRRITMLICVLKHFQLTCFVSWLSVQRT